ncbi:hypothetical protein AeRB84_013012 [Aphanomyces euteiches]|nr:hypothetical protein AeRB84_013012 [Aphanomyces euteiches]
MPGKKKAVDVAFKLQVIADAKAKNNLKAPKKHRVSRSSIQEWRKQEESLRKLFATNPSAKRLSGGGRKLTSEDLEEILFERVLYERFLHHRVTRTMITAWGVELCEELEVTLLCSSGWLARFLERHNFVQRKATRKPIHTEDEIIRRAVAFYANVRRIIEEFNVPPEHIYNFDESAVFFDHTNNSTIDLCGARDVPLKTFGLEKSRITAVFCANAVGMKKKPFLLVKPNACNHSKTVESNGIAVCPVENAWMNSDVFVHYLEFNFRYHQRPLLLVFDSARSHISKKVKAYLHQENILYAVIPGGLTPYLQPADYSWFKALKSHLIKEIDTWKVNGPFELTHGNRVKPPSHCVYSSWIKRSWEKVTAESIITSWACPSTLQWLKASNVSWKLTILKRQITHPQTTILCQKHLSTWMTYWLWMIHSPL